MSGILLGINEYFLFWQSEKQFLRLQYVMQNTVKGLATDQQHILEQIKNKIDWNDVFIFF